MLGVLFDKCDDLSDSTTLADLCKLRSLGVPSSTFLLCTRDMFLMECVAHIDDPHLSSEDKVSKTYMLLMLAALLKFVLAIFTYGTRVRTLRCWNVLFIFLLSNLSPER